MRPPAGLAGPLLVLGLWFAFGDKKVQQEPVDGQVSYYELCGKLGLATRTLKINDDPVEWDKSTGLTTRLGEQLEQLQQHQPGAGSTSEQPVLVGGVVDTPPLSAKEFVAQPCYKLKQRLSDRASYTKTVPRRPRTFEDLEPWNDFMESSRQLYNGLDDTDCKYKPMVVIRGSVLADGVPAFHATAADEEVVKRTIIDHMMEPASLIASDLGYGVEYTDKGSGRHASNTDHILRKLGVSQLSNVSLLMLGAIEVKGGWQLALDGTHDLVALFHDAEWAKKVTPAIQQVYGDAVMDDAPIMILSNYEVTYFLIRDVADVGNKVLRVSPPISWNNQHPPPVACWLYVLKLASELWNDGVKARLPHGNVPRTPSGGHAVVIGDLTLVLHSRFFAKGVIVRQQQQQQQQRYNLRKRRRQQGLVQQQQQLSVEEHSALQSTGGSRSTCPESASRGGAGSSGNTGISSSSMQGQEVWRAWADDAMDRGVLAVEDLPFLDSDFLGYSDTMISRSPTSTILQGSVEKVSVAAKVYNLTPQAVQEFLQEASNFVKLTLSSINGIIPLLAVGRLPHTGQPVLALAMGQPLPQPVTPSLAASAKTALAALHTAGFSHGDISARNLLLCEGAVVFCDLQTCKAHATEAECQQEVVWLASALGQDEAVAG